MMNTTGIPSDNTNRLSKNMYSPAFYEQFTTILARFLSGLNKNEFMEQIFSPGWEEKPLKAIIRQWVFTSANAGETTAVRWKHNFKEDHHPEVLPHAIRDSYYHERPGNTPGQF